MGQGRAKEGQGWGRDGTGWGRSGQGRGRGEAGEGHVGGMSMWKMHLRQRERCCLLMEMLTMTVHPLTNFSECPFLSTYSKLLSARPLDTDTLLDLMTECSENARRSGHPHRPQSVHMYVRTHIQ